MKQNHLHRTPRRNSHALVVPYTVERLEERRLLSASAISNLGNVTAHFTMLSNSHLREVIGNTQVDLGLIQSLYQGKDAAGHNVAFEWVNKSLNEFTPNKGWVTIGAADMVAQDSGQAILFTQGTTLYLATGVPGADVAILGNVQALTSVNGEAIAQIGSYFKASVTAKMTAGAGPATLAFTNVQMNVGRFGADFLGAAITELQSFTKPLQPLADALENNGPPRG